MLPSKPRGVPRVSTSGAQSASQTRVNALMDHPTVITVEQNVLLVLAA